MKEKKYLIFAMSRSGHHAVINWISANTSKTIIHYNNCIRNWDSGGIDPLSNKIICKKGVGDEKIILKNIEDMDLYNFEKIVGSDKYDIIIINRDPKNWIASSIKNGGHTEDNLDKDWFDEVNNKMRSRVEIYKSLLRESMGETNYTSKDVIDINYNRWFISDEYRKELSEKLNLDSYDKGLEIISQWGGGSSFDGLKINNGKKLDVLNRWVSFKNNPKFNNALDDEILSLEEKYFNK